VLRDQIVHRLCGVRPLPRASGDVGAVTRDHSIVTLALPGTAVPVLCLIGGKWTTFRAFSELAADRVLVELGLLRKVSTRGLAIGGGREFPKDAAGRLVLAAELAKRGRISETRAEVLLARYGTLAGAYVDSLRGRGETMLASAPDYARDEIRHIAATERVGGLEDILYRRTLLALTGWDRPAVRAEIAALLEARPERASA
jgi:glycerol-3-phosphate dehydrogenase